MVFPRLLRPLRAGAPMLAGLAAGALFGAAARLRRAKPIHPAGAVLAASVRWTGTESNARRAWGSPWLDKRGEVGGFVRLSRSFGLPHPLPDALGFALRVPAGGGRASDLLLTTCAGRAPYLRRILFPRFDAATTYSSLLSYRTARGPAVIAAWPLDERSLPPATPDLAEALTARPLTFGLHVTEPGGEWERFATVEIGGPLSADIDPPVSFDPVRNAPPGLSLYETAAQVRGRSYASARRNRPHGDEPAVATRRDLPMSHHP